MRPGKCERRQQACATGPLATTPLFPKPAAPPARSPRGAPRALDDHGGLVPVVQRLEEGGLQVVHLAVHARQLRRGEMGGEGSRLKFRWGAHVSQLLLLPA
jgi:hypothetical protein